MNAQDIRLATASTGEDGSMPTIIRTADDMARFLTRICPRQSAAFARAAHERACWTLDDERIAFWDAVASRLKQLASGTAAAA